MKNKKETENSKSPQQGQSLNFNLNDAAGNNDDVLHNFRENNEQFLLLRQRALAGDGNAQFQMGQNYFFGNEELGIQPDNQEAYQWFERAANNNHQQATIDLAIMLLNSTHY